MKLVLDHIAVVAANLREGCEYVQDKLGVEVPYGGFHPDMGTHNHLARLGDDEFLEIITVNPDAPTPEHPRWFNIDNHGEAEPYLAHWIARSDALDDLMPLIKAPTGNPRTMRRGDLTWRLTVPEDGSFAFDGAFPSLTDWPMRPFPGSAMADIGCRLESLVLTHPQAAGLTDALMPVLDDSRVSIEEGSRVSLTATIDTPNGVRVLT